MNVKFKIVCPLLFIALGIVMPACTDSDDEIGGNDTPPAGALPSAGFEPNNLPDEPYAEDAVLIVAEERYAPFVCSYFFCPRCGECRGKFFCLQKP